MRIQSSVSSALVLLVTVLSSRDILALAWCAGGSTDSRAFRETRQRFGLSEKQRGQKCLCRPTGASERVRPRMLLGPKFTAANPYAMKLSEESSMDAGYLLTATTAVTTEHQRMQKDLKTDTRRHPTLSQRTQDSGASSSPPTWPGAKSCKASIVSSTCWSE